MSLTFYHAQGATVWTEGTPCPAGVYWIDLHNPTREEECVLEKHLSIEIPTREEMREIEISNRLYQEHAHVFMTGTLVAKFDSGDPENHAVTFIVAPDYLVTLRYADPVPFRLFPAYVQRMRPEDRTGPILLVELLDHIMNRAADILEKIGQDIDRITKIIFKSPEVKPEVSYQHALEQIGHCGDSTSKASESLITLSRLVSYAAQVLKNLSPVHLEHLAETRRDIAALSDHASFLSNKISFLLDATLGMISIEQNNIIKIFSIAAVVFLPPTLIASIYGMNFHHMPELDKTWGYPVALLVMLVAAILPIWYFKRKKWL